ncbi:unnamed protein product [Ambrosiozyma monospora]|uniref:Unnamed protein product n=1 Tax=Ambrosiozyma monospora TaxID=43982 RepID=A0ACB5T4V3_AMBMO|nr:unnamed protein product [Ambrosiozyma monospora]
MLGTPPYQPPEVGAMKNVLLKERSPYDQFKFDYWSLGMMLFALLWGKTPFQEARVTDLNYVQYEAEHSFFCQVVPGFNRGDVSRVPTLGRFAQNFPDGDCCRIAWRLCSPNPRNRITLPELFADKYFQNISMCINESQYECNFLHHAGTKYHVFESVYGDEVELIDIGKTKKTNSVISQKSSANLMRTRSVHRSASTASCSSSDLRQIRQDFNESKSSTVQFHNNWLSTKEPTSAPKTLLSAVDPLTTTNVHFNSSSNNTIINSNNSTIINNSENTTLPIRNLSTDSSNTEASLMDRHSRSSSSSRSSKSVSGTDIFEVVKQLETLGESSEEEDDEDASVDSQEILESHNHNDEVAVDEASGISDGAIIANGGAGAGAGTGSISSDDSKNASVIQVDFKGGQGEAIKAAVDSKLNLKATQIAGTVAQADSLYKSNDASVVTGGEESNITKGSSSVAIADGASTTTTTTGTTTADADDEAEDDDKEDELTPEEKYLLERSFVTVDGDVLRYEFTEEDYSPENKETEYMVVPLCDIEKSLQFDIVTHNHASYV